jgi:hypothetical protein
MPDVDKFLNELFLLTDKLNKAIKNENIEEMGKLLQSRQALIDNFDSQGIEFDEKQKNLKIKISKLDKEASILAQNFKSKVKGKIENLKKVNSGLIKYSKINYDFSSGQIVDKKR